VTSADGEPAPLGSRAASGVAWLTIQTWIAKIGGFVTVVVLARLLTPDDFGLVAVAMTVVPLVYLLADLGFGTYLMQSREATTEVASTAFWYAATSGVVLAVLLIACAPLLEMLFGVPGVAAVIAWMSPAVIFVSLAAVPIALLRRRLRFRALSIQAAIAAIVAQAVAIGLALAGAGVWALVVQVSVAQALTLAGAWIASRWMPTRHFSWQEFRLMLGFGSKVVGTSGIATLRLWAENAIISNVLGAAALGQLSVAQRLVQTGQEVAGAAIAPVSTVAFSQVRDDPDRLRRGYDRALSLSYVVIAPAMTAILVTAPLLIPVLFGDQWGPSIPAAQALAVAAIFTMAATLDHGLFYGLGRPGTWLIYATVVDALTVLTTIFTVTYGINGVTLGFVGVAIAATIVRWVMVARVIDVPVWRVARRVLAALVAVSVSGLAGWGTLLALSAFPPLAAIAAAGVVILLVHLGMSRFLLPGGYKDLVDEVRVRVLRKDRK